MKQGRVRGQHMGTGKGKRWANEERKAGEEARETEAERKGLRMESWCRVGAAGDGGHRPCSGSERPECEREGWVFVLP